MEIGSSITLGRAANLHRRLSRDNFARKSFLLLTTLPLALLLSLLLVLTIRSWPILERASLWGVLSGRIWLPSQGQFGFLPFILGTLWVTVAAVLLAVPPCLLTAIYLVEYARPALKNAIKPLIDILAAIPSVVYGVWGVVAIVPIVEKLGRQSNQWLGFIPLFSSQNPTGYSILAGAIVLAVMIAPFMVAVAYEVLESVSRGSREASLAVGATRWQTVKHAVLPQARSGIIAGVVLGASRALGETMAVLMVVGNVPQIPRSLFDAAYPLPALIANNYGEMLSIPLYDAALMMAALILLLVVLVFNVFATLILRQAVRRTVV